MSTRGEREGTAVMASSEVPLDQYMPMFTGKTALYR